MLFHAKYLPTVMTARSLQNLTKGEHVAFCAGKYILSVSVATRAFVFW